MGRMFYSNRELVENSLQLSIKAFMSIFQSEKEITCGKIIWAKGSKIGMKVNKLNNAITLDYVITRNEHKYHINYTIHCIQQPCNYGKHRYYFECPACKNKVYKIYKPSSNNYFACRKCHNLTYSEQKEHNKRMDAFTWMKYEWKIERLMMTGKIKDKNKALKLQSKKTKLFSKYKYLMQSFFSKINPAF